MRPLLHPSLINGRFGDPVLYAETLFGPGAILFDLGDIALLPPRKLLRLDQVEARPAPVVRIAQAMGLTRQSVQRIVDALEQEGVVAFRENPHHKRAKRVTLTAKGTALYRSAMRLQKPWATRLGGRLDRAALATALSVLKTLRARFETEKSGGRP